MTDKVLDAADPQTQPMPEGGWSEGIVTLQNATVVPPVQGGFVQPAGVLDETGHYCDQGALWRKFRPITTEPEYPTGDIANLSGRWLWGGVLWAHFGHFLVESTARLWGLDNLDKPVDGVVFIPKRPRAGDAVRGFHKDFLNLLAPDLPIQVVADPTQIEELVVPGQGFGLGKITAGTEKFRAAIHSNFAKDIKPDGPEKIYISRSALGLGKGGLLGEEHLENMLVAEGYEVFHPQKYDIATQISRYKAAKQIIAADGSAVHLYAMVGKPNQSVAIILRRESTANNLLASNVSHFCGTDPLMISALRTEWVRPEKLKSNRLSFGELDHEKIGRALTHGGFVSKGMEWQNLDEDARNKVFVDRGLVNRDRFVESPKYVKARVRALRDERRTTRAG